MASNITNDFKRKAGLSAGAPDTLTDPLATGAPAQPLQQVESAQPTLRQVAPGVTETGTPGVFTTEPVQNPGRAMPRPASVFDMKLENVAPRPGSNESLRSAFANAAPQPQAGPSMPPPEAPAGVSRADILGASPVTDAQGLRRIPFDTSRAFTPFDDAAKQFGQAAGDMGQAVKDSRLTNNFITNNPLTRGAAGLVGGAAKVAGKVLPALGAGYEGVQAAQDAGNGDTLGAVNHGVNSLASAALYTPAAPVAGAYLGGQAAGSFINSAMSQDQKDTLGGVINQGLRNLGIGGVDDSALLRNRAEAAQSGRVTTAVNSPEKFQQQYGAAAQRAGEQLGVDPKLLLAQWGMETGWGRSVVPGTNNLGNIKDFSKTPGEKFTDNATGSRDKYLKFGTPEDFADHYVGLMNRMYPGVQGAGGDPAKFAAGLMNGAHKYAQDLPNTPTYASRIAGAYQRVGGNSQKLSAPGATQPTLAQGAAPAAAPLDDNEIVTAHGGHFQGTRKSLAEFGLQPDAPGAEAARLRLSSMMDKVRDRYDGHIDPAIAANVMKTWADSEGLRGQTAANLENARATRAMTAAEHQRQALQFGVTAQREQETQNRLAAADQQNRIQTANAAMQRAIEDHFTTVDPGTGKPTFDANKAGTMRRYMDTALGTLASSGKAKSFADLDAGDKDKLMAASELMDKVQSSATDWPLGWKPNFLKTSNPLDLIGAEELPNGDLRTPTRTIDGRDVKGGDIIPAWMRRRADGSYLGDKLGFGKPTTAYEKLIGRKVSK